jgi:hypothetical protein
MPNINDEVWETTTAGTVWVVIPDSRGDMRQIKVGGRRGARLRIATDDRVWNQERCVDEKHDPFTNGLLAQISGPKPEPRPAITQDPEPNKVDQSLSTDKLVAMFAKHGNAFHSQVRGLNELNLRRLKELSAEVDASVKQVELIDQLLEAYKPGGQQGIYAELQGIGSGMQPA